MLVLQIARMQTPMKTIVVSLMLVTVFTAINQSSGANVSEIMESTMPAYAIAKYSHDLLLSSNECRRYLEIFQAAVDNRVLWSLRMLDVSGQPTPGFVNGNNYWLGLKNQCYDLNNHKPIALHPDVMMNNSLYRNPAEEYPPYDVHFFAAHMVQNSTVQYHMGIPSEHIVSLGLCLPEICRSTELAVILDKIFSDRILTITSLYGADFSLIEVKSLKPDDLPDLNWRMIIVLVVILVTLMLMIAGTCYDLGVHQKRLEAAKSMNISNGPQPNTSSSDTQKRDKFTKNDNDEVTSIQKATTVENGITPDLAPVISKPSIPERMILSFSIYTNSKELFNVSQSKGIGCLDGLRFLSMVYTLMVHTVLFGQWYTDNKPWAWRLGEELMNQIVTNGSITVDTYFFISAFLLSYIFFKMQKKKNSIVPRGFNFGVFIVAFVKRFIRLTPPYMMVVGVSELLAICSDKMSVPYIDDAVDEKCGNYWWRNLLYINNLFPRSEMCLAWSWYLSNEMQFFLIGMALLLLSTKYLYTVMGTIVILLGAHVAITGYIAYEINYVPTLDVWWNTIDFLYDTPWVRIGPSLVGLATGYLLAVHGNKIKFNKKTLWICWILGAGCNLFVLFGIYDKTIYYNSRIVSIAYGATWRTLWAIGIAWLVVACSTGNGGFINKILSFKGWMPGSKLTYCAYLINPMLIVPLYLSSELAFHVDFLPNEVLFLGFTIVTYFVSYIWALMFEIPYMLLIKIWDESQKKK